MTYKSIFNSANRYLYSYIGEITPACNSPTTIHPNINPSNPSHNSSNTWETGKNQCRGIPCVRSVFCVRSVLFSARLSAEHNSVKSVQ